jgi:hypothetical protein
MNRKLYLLVTIGFQFEEWQFLQSGDQRGREYVGFEGSTNSNTRFATRGLQLKKAERWRKVEISFTNLPAEAFDGVAWVAADERWG